MGDFFKTIFNYFSSPTEHLSRKLVFFIAIPLLLLFADWYFQFSYHQQLFNRLEVVKSINEVIAEGSDLSKMEKAKLIEIRERTIMERHVFDRIEDAFLSEDTSNLVENVPVEVIEKGTAIKSSFWYIFCSVFVYACLTIMSVFHFLDNLLASPKKSRPFFLRSLIPLGLAVLSCCLVYVFYNIGQVLPFWGDRFWLNYLLLIIFQYIPVVTVFLIWLNDKSGDKNIIQVQKAAKNT